jgi:hypothetical protein
VNIKDGVRAAVEALFVDLVVSWDVEGTYSTQFEYWPQKIADSNAIKIKIKDMPNTIP